MKSRYVIRTAGYTFFFMCIYYAVLYSKWTDLLVLAAAVATSYGLVRDSSSNTTLVGVVTPRDDLFDEWVRQNKVPGEQYVQVSKEEDLGSFDRIEPGFLWETLGNLYFKAKLCSQKQK